MIEATPYDPDAVMRLRSEPFAPNPRRFVPASAEVAVFEADPALFDRLSTALAAALGALAGDTATVRLNGATRPDWAGNGSAAADSLVAAVTAARFGGVAGDGSMAGGSAAQRIRERLAAALDALAAQHWPAEAGQAGVAVTLTLGGATHELWIAAPPRPATPRSDGPHMADALLALPFRMPVSVSAEMAELTRLLPLAKGAIWPISPQPVVPLRIGGQRIGSVRIEPTPDGRQQAIIIEGARA